MQILEVRGSRSVSVLIKANKCNNDFYIKNNLLKRTKNKLVWIPSNIAIHKLIKNPIQYYVVDVNMCT